MAEETGGGLEIFRLFGSVFLKGGDETNKQLDQIDQKAEKTGGTFGKIAGGVAKAGALVAGAAVAVGTAVLGFATKSSEASSRVNDMSTKLGISKTAFQEYDYVMKMVGGSAESLQAGIKTLSNQAVTATEGINESSKAFEELGITVTDTQGNMKSQEQLLNETIKALSGMEDETRRTALGSQLLGKSAMELTPILAMGAEEFENTKKKAHELGLVLSDEAIGAGDEFGDTMETLKLTVGSLMTQAITPLLPILNDLMNEFIEILPSLMDFIRPLLEKLMPVVEKLIAKLLPVFLELLDALMPILDPLIDIFLILLDNGLIPIMELLAEAIAEILPPFMELLEALMPIIKPLIEIFTTLLGIVTSLFLEAVREVAEIVLPLFTAAFEKIGPIIEGAIKFINDLIKGFLSLFTQDWTKTWQGAKDFFTKIWEGIKKFFVDLPGNIIKWLKDALNAILGLVPNALATAKTFGQNIFDGIKSFFIDLPKNIITWLTNAIKAIIGLVPQALQAAKDFGKGILDGIMSFITGIPEKIANVVSNAAKSVGNFFGNLLGTNKQTTTTTPAITTPKTTYNVPSNIPGYYTGMGGYAEGTDYVPKTGNYIVGEEGPELVSLPQGGGVKPIKAADTFIVNINNPKFFNQDDAKELSNLIYKRWQMFGVGMAR